MANLKKVLKEIKRNKAPYLFISPFYIMFLAFMVIPIFYSFYLSLTELRGVRPPNFIGFTNYANLLQDTRFWTALRNTSVFAAVQIPLMMSIAITLALILNSPGIRFRNFFRSMYFLPVVMSLVVAALSFSMILSVDIGLLNLLLKRIGLTSHDWLNDPDLALPSIIVLATWRWTGYNIVILLAGLQNIPLELYEAAKIDGAGMLQRVRYVTLPLLRPIIFFCVMMSIIGSYQLFEEPYILTNKGGPMDRTLTIVLYLFETGFQKYRLGYASAIAYSLVLVIFIVSALQMKFFWRRTGVE
jgi:lactose/L-arabinose transport system permease protein